MRLVVFLVALLLIWLPLAAPIYLLGRDPNLVSILTIVLLYAEFILLLRFWSKHVYHQRHLLRQYGLERTQRNGLEVLTGLGIGITTVLSLFGIEAVLGWLIWQQPNVFLPQIILEGLIVALAIGFAEELLFRGWLLDELQRDYRLGTALWVNAFIFALAHFIKPLAAILQIWPQFPALLLLGLILVWAKRSRHNRLGLPIGFHAGLVWGYYIINVGNLVKYSGSVPEWITGVDRNPLAGIMGLLFLGCIAFWIRRRSLQHQRRSPS